MTIQDYIDKWKGKRLYAGDSLYCEAIVQIDQFIKDLEEIQKEYSSKDGIRSLITKVSHFTDLQGTDHCKATTETKE